MGKAPTDGDDRQQASNGGPIPHPVHWIPSAMNSGFLGLPPFSIPPGWPNDFRAYAVGRIGRDEPGWQRIGWANHVGEVGG
jgi:hypothetical protein